MWFASGEAQEIEMFTCCMLAQIARSARMTAAVESITSSRLHKSIGSVTSFPSVAKKQVISLRWKVCERCTEAGSKRVSSCICFISEIRNNYLSKVVNEKGTHLFLFKTQVETEKDSIPAEHNTFTQFDVRAYNSPSRTFLYVRAIRVCFMKFLIAP